MSKFRVALICAFLVPVGAMAADDMSDVKLNVGGFIWGDVGFGDRYDGSDDDQVNIEKAAVSVSPEYKNTRASIMFGVDNILSDDPGSNGSNDDIEAVEAFVGIYWDLAGGKLDLTVGKQGLLFGLKPNGWVGDHSVNQGLEYGSGNGAAGPGINVSGQVQTSVIVDWSLDENSNDSWSVRAGLFDGTGDTSMTDNWFIQGRTDNLLGTGVYGNVGYEQVDVGGSSEGIISIGAGMVIAKFDLSLEYQGIDQAIAGTAGDETQIIAEAMWNYNEDWSFYLDYATSDELDFDTTRLGAVWDYNEHFYFQLEYANDSSNINALDVNSIDLRLAFTF